MTIRKRYGFGIALFVLALVVLTLFLAPRQSELGNGSTYSRLPGGYGAWYGYMADRGTPVQRWEKPVDTFLTAPEGGIPGSELPNEPITLLQIQSDFVPSVSPIVYDKAWLSQGNVLVQVGIRSRVTRAPFESAIASASGDVVVETRRRHPLTRSMTYQAIAEANPTALLEDEYGAITWQETVGNGRAIFIVTPYLAANAHQDAPGNFEFLAALLDEIGHPVYVDEYLHGYKDDETVRQEVQSSLWVYLWQTPIPILAFQAVLGLALLVWGLNQRLGALLIDSPPAQDSNRAYIDALAAVLRKANSTDFTVETLRRAEYLQVQRSLGLGDTPLDPATVATAWEAQTGRSPDELRPVLPTSDSTEKAPSMSEAELLRWLQAVDTIRRHLPNRGLPSPAEAASPVVSSP